MDVITNSVLNALILGVKQRENAHFADPNSLPLNIKADSLIVKNKVMTNKKSKILTSLLTSLSSLGKMERSIQFPQTHTQVI